MKTTILATALTLIAIGASPAAAQADRTEPPATPKTTAGEAPPHRHPRRQSRRWRPRRPPRATPRPRCRTTKTIPISTSTSRSPTTRSSTCRRSLRMPKGKFAFRVTHRFGRPLDDGDFGDLASDLFGLDAGGLIGLELRYGLLKGTQVGVLRTSDRTIQFFAQQQIVGAGEVPAWPGAQSHGRRHQQLPRQLLARYRPDRLARDRQGRGGVLRADLGQQHQHASLRSSWMRTARSCSASARASGSRRRMYLVAEAAPRVSGYDAGIDRGRASAWRCAPADTRSS